ncbi:MAG: hypothetical protein DRN66_03640 [Candidatus Nanohalarchaeota archaeon]|nr:MAG: hypothetical protein DRN66_03640 [Candidatus Nanohaloarchaeota archaeon]
MNKAIFLMTLLLLAGVAAADAGNAFPQDEAGISAYINTGGAIDIEQAATAYTAIEELGSTHAIGTIAIKNVHATDHIHVYVDVNGWIVAYLKRDEQTGKIVQWSGGGTTFANAISKVCSKIGVDYNSIKDNITYYDFKYPDAGNMTIFKNTRSSNGDDYTHAFLPDNNTLYEASYSFVNTIRHRESNTYPYDSYYGWSKLYLNGAYISGTGVSNRRTVSVYTGFTVGELHTIRLQRGDHSGLGWSGVASVLIYS